MKEWICNNIHLLYLSVINHLNLLCVSIITILTPICPLMLTVGFLIVVDFIFGISRSMKLYGFESVTSRKMSITASKMLLYNLIIITVYILEVNLISTGLPLAKMSAGFIGLMEIKSIDESFTSIFGWSFWSKLKKLVLRGTSETKDIIKDIK